MTFDKALELLDCDRLGVHLDLQRHQYREEELVINVKTSNCVREGHEGQIVEDVLDPLGSERRPVRVGQRNVEELQELSKRRLIHDVDASHRHDQEVQN